MSKKTKTIGSDRIAKSIKNLVEGTINTGKRLPMKSNNPRSVPMMKVR
jgi:hypothetical protein